MASSSSSLSLSFPSGSLSGNWEHDVFPSFHGQDVRQKFLSHIRKEFRRKAINLFIDNEIKRGEFIGPELKRAIRGSKIAVVLLSKNYASSSWCLDELVEIMKKESGQTVMTIFYEVDPTDVKKQQGDFGKVFKNTCQGKERKKIDTWRKALEGVATIAGYHSSNWDDEAVMIENIAADISRKLNHLIPSHDFDHLIGMGDHMQKINLLLRLDLDEVRMIGIWGPSGIGKTTIARFLFNQVSTCFQNSAIMVNIKGNYPRPCNDEYTAQLQLQKEMLSQMIHQKDMEISHLGVAQGRLGDRKVLLVLDGVDRLAQLDALAKNVKWFGPKSRIIITTENLTLLKAHSIDHIYKVNFPSTDEALHMFCMYAFDEKYPKDGFAVLAREITYLVGELPLGLKVMGSYFRGLAKEQWSMEVSRLRSNLNGEIESVLRFSYDALCDEDKDLFRHIACFFNHEDVGRVEEHLAKSFKNVRQGLHVLAEKSLISIDDRYILCMHNLLAQFGKDIVRKQSIREPGQREFLVDNRDISEVLTGYTKITRSVIGIDSTSGLTIAEKGFKGMSNLQFLRVRSTISSPGPLKFKSLKLRLLDWSYFPMICLPFDINLEFLVELRMVCSKLEKLWDGIKLLPNLKWIDISFSTNLKELPNLSMATSLEYLSLSGCSSLVEVPSSIGNASNLYVIYLDGCSSLVELPSFIENATKLKEVDLRGCSSIVKLPSFIENATCLYKLDLNGCSSLVVLPSSIGNATNLQELCLCRCSSLVELPSSIGNASNLYELYLYECASLVELPFSIGNLINLQKLNLYGCSSLVELPSSIGNATNLRELNLGRCLRLMDLPSSLGNATNLQELCLSECSSMVELPSFIGNATYLYKLDLNGCSNLVSLPQLSDSLKILDARYCESLEKLNCSFCNPDICLDFVNCFKLNQEARDLIIHTSTLESVVLPGGNMPECFTYRAYGSSVTVKLNQKPLPTSTKFKSCILLNEVRVHEGAWVSCRIKTKQKALTKRYLHPVISEHLYIFDIEAEEVTSTELVFEFEFDEKIWGWEIKECGIIQLVEHHVDEKDERFRGGDEVINENIASESLDEEDEILENHVHEEDERFRGSDEAINEKIASESIDEEDEILENHVDDEDERFRGGDEAMYERRSLAFTSGSSKRRRICCALFCLLFAFLLHSLFLNSSSTPGRF